MLRRPAHALLLGLVLALAGCGGDESTPGGADDLPPPVPEGVVFAEPPPGGLPAPDFSAPLLDGTRVEAADLWDERPLVLVFTASWCGRCAGVHRDAAAAVDEHDDAIALLGVVAGDDEAPAREYAEELDLGHPVAVAGERIWLNYAAREPPVVVLVARGGRVLRGWPGGVGRALLARSLAELVERPADPE